jgi:hypothetical protein
MPKMHMSRPNLLVFHCPGCLYDHLIGVNGRQILGAAGTMISWEWNGSLDRPTIAPSLLVFKDSDDRRCHCFIEDGKIWFLSDCCHSLKGKTVKLPEWDQC